MTQPSVLWRLLLLLDGPCCGLKCVGWAAASTSWTSRQEAVSLADDPTLAAHTNILCPLQKEAGSILHEYRMAAPEISFRAYIFPILQLSYQLLLPPTRGAHLLLLVVIECEGVGSSLRVV